MKTLTLRVEDDLSSRLDQLAHETGRSKSYYARLAIQQFLEDREDYLLGIAVIERNESTISLDELERELGLAS
jgi:RHH-type rel operon transcriptional repressor/antitoxin RelB